MRIFLLAGKAKSGKSTIAKLIKEYYDHKEEKTVISEYSKYLKMYAREMTDWNGENHTKPRKFLQEMGTYIRKHLNMPDFFINRMKEDIKIYEKFFNNLIISDVRFPSEIEKIKAKYPNVYSFLIIKDSDDYNLTIKEANHETEKALDDYDDFDYYIENNQKENIKETIIKILEEIE